MIKASELRIGNYIKSELYKDILQINMIDLCGVIGIQGGGMLDMKHIEPIPITEEWLLKFGLGQCENENWFEKKVNRLGIVISVNLNGRMSIEDNKDEMITIRECCYYLHQLQNLYFALTGDELKPINN